MAFDEDNILQDYIARLLTMQDERDEWLEEEDLKTTALELGLSEADIQRIEKTIEAHRQRGLNFIEHASWDEAVDELKQAMALAPLDVSLIHELARAHLGRWKATGHAEDQEAAERYTRRCIQLDPEHKASYELLQDMKRIPIRATQSGRPTSARAKLFFFLLLGVVLVVTLLLLWLLVSGSNAGSAPPPPPPPTGNAATAPAPAISSEIPAGDTMPAEATLPVRFTDAELRFDVQRSLFKNFGESFSYNLDAGLLVEDTELHRLRLKLELLGPDGDVLLTDYVDALSDHEPYLRPGDTAPLGALIYQEQTPPLIQEVRVSVDLMEQETAATDYGRDQALPVTWEFQKPAYLNLDIYQRESGLTDTFNGRSHFLTLATRNTGQRAVHRLRLKITWYDAQENALTSKLTYVVLSSGPSLQGGATWVTRTIGTFPQEADPPFAGYEVSVVEAE